jgi:16S rRNA (cytidine1402-2'-O)-methyltransferase
MPCISDPGEELVREAHKQGVNVVVVPGPSAVISALSISGMKSGRFTFEGFLSVNRPSRRKHLAEIQNEKRTMVFYEAPHKLLATLKDLHETLGNREITIARELTKIHEEIKKTTLKDAFAFYSENAPKGEFVLLIEGKPEREENYTFRDAVNFAKEWVKKGESATTAAKRAAELTGFKKSEIYKELY